MCELQFLVKTLKTCKQTFDVNTAGLGYIKGDKD